MDQQKIARTLVLSIFAFAACFLAFAGYHFHRQSQLESSLVDRGVETQGLIVEKSQSSPGSSSSASPTYVLEVRYEYEGTEYSNPYSVTSSRYEKAEVGEAITVTVDPEKPKLSQLTEYVGQPLGGRGFIPISED